MSETPVSLRGLNRATLARQMLLSRERIKPLRAIERLVGLQAQLPRPPHVGLWSRLEGFRREDLLALLQRRDAVRATMMRGTLHVVSAKDYSALRATLQPMLTRAMVTILRDRLKGLDVEKLAAEAEASLTEQPRTFTQLREVLSKRHPKGDERAMGFAVRCSLPLVQVPTEDAWGFPADSCFAPARAWLGGTLRASDASEDLVLRYLAAFGPATATDVQTWSGLQGVKEVIERLRPKLHVLHGERKRVLYDLKAAPRPSEDAIAPARFLPEFDNLLLSHTDRRRFVADRFRSRVFLPALRIAPTFLVDGFVAGSWSAKRAKDAATLTIEPFEPLAKATQSELAAEGERLLRFLETSARSFDVKIVKPASKGP
jgi:Winged helix DNA-binding domain